MGFSYRILRPAASEGRQKLPRSACVLNAMSPADRADIGIKPADFPRIAREMSLG